MTTILITIDSDGVCVLANDDNDRYFADRLCKDEALGEIASWLYAGKQNYGVSPTSLMRENRMKMEQAQAIEKKEVPFDGFF